MWSAVGLLLGDDTAASERGWIRDVQPARTSWLTEAAKVASTLGTAGVLSVAVSLLAVLLVIRGRPGLALFLVLAAFGGIGLPVAVKAIVGRPRPPVALRYVSVVGSSFPSGHATQNAAILPAIALALTGAGYARRVALSLAALGAVLVGISRVLLGVHYPSDVLAGWLLGAAWLGCCAWTLLRCNPG